MPTLVKDQQIVEDNWQIIESTDVPQTTTSIVPFSAIARATTCAVWVECDFAIEEHGKQLLKLDLVAIHFPAFADGRGLSLATLLRTRYQFTGELRAFGTVQPDLTPFMLRCGFDSFLLEDVQAAETAIRCMSGVSDFYQGSAIDPLPAYRRARRPRTS